MSNKFRLFALSGVAFGAMSLAGAAFAQDTTDEDTDVVVTTDDSSPAEEEAESRQGRVVVTGSLLRRDEYTSAAPIQVITAETATLEGLIDTAEILQSSSVAAGSTQINGNFGGFVVEGGTGVNTVSLRGLGGQRTLILFNGRRLGPAGTQGQVGAVDINVIPDAVVQRFEILKDGASSIYGSDAIGGVVNVITRRQIDDPEINISIDRPFENGGESYGIDGAFGLNFDKGSMVFAASYEKFEDLSMADRDAFSCAEDYVFDPDTGERSDIIDPFTGEYKCWNMLTNVFDINGVGRWIYDPTLGTYRQGTSSAEYNYQQPESGRQDVIPETERISLYVTGDYDFGFAQGFVDALYNNRKTESSGIRQFFPYLPPSVSPTDAGPAYGRPIVLFPSDASVDIDYFSVSGGLRGDFGSVLDSWTWELGATWSKSDGTYTNDSIPLNRTQDFGRDGDTAQYFRNGDGSIGCVYVPEDQLYYYFDYDPSNDDQWDYAECPGIDYFTPEFLSGNLTDEEWDYLVEKDVGNTTYEQAMFSALASGELFELPAGPIGMAIGVEYRTYEINDVPGPLSQGVTVPVLECEDPDDTDPNCTLVPVLGIDGEPLYETYSNRWGQLSAVTTAGEDSVVEIFGEVEIPILAGLPLAEELTLNASGRYFDYDSFGEDTVYKLGLNWQVSPLLRLRSTFGTSYRTPALYELFLGNQTSFLGQSSVDVCAEWGDSTNANLRANCAADGVPEDYSPLGSSAQITTGGGAGNLSPETSEAFTAGFIITPSFIDLNVAVDYFEIEINDQIARLGAGSIVSGCYTSDTFPNDPFCALFTRDTDPSSLRYLEITGVNDSYVNINSQKTSGLDITARFEQEMDIGDLIVDIQGTWTFEDEFLLFSGEDFAPDLFNGTIGDPDFVANGRIQFVKGDWRFNWFTDFVSRTSNDQFYNGSPYFTYRDGSTAYYKQWTEPQWYHGASVQYRGDQFAVTVGIDNLFDETPPWISTGAGTRRGNVALVGTQFDYRGRSAFVRLSKSF